MKRKPLIVVVDYGVGNLYSLARAFRFLDTEVVITEDPKIISQADGIVLPGVGSFEAGMKGLKMRGLTDEVKKFAKKNKPMLGICLGAQLMMTKGYELGVFKGLDIIKGKVVRFPASLGNEKIPQIGWNTISPNKKGSGSGILTSLHKNDQVYFVHSYVIVPKSKGDILALTTYGGYTFCSVIGKGNIYGVQFHPEKSGLVGLKLIGNFIKLVKNKSK